MRRTLGACCAAHFLVDFACAYLLFAALRGSPAWTELLIVYNFCAFALQMPLGLLADGWGRDGETAALGAALVALAYAAPGVPWLAAVTAGLGNAAFHVGGGFETLSLSGRRAGPLGLFVSPGAVGLFFGTALGKEGGLPLWLPPLLLVLAAGALLRTRTALRRPPAGLPDISKVGPPLAALLAVVALRSYVGMSLTFPWRGTGQWALGLTLALALGKAAGGYLADCAGFVKTAAGSLLLCAGALLFSTDPACGTAAVFLFNMTMPLTLWAAARLLPGLGGFAFGLLTFGLFLGYLPAAFGAPALSENGAALLAALSLALLLPGLRKAVRK